MAKRGSEIETVSDMEQVMKRLDRMESAITSRMDRIEDKLDVRLTDVQKAITTIYWRLLLLTLGTISGTAALVKVLDYLFQ